MKKNKEDVKMLQHIIKEQDARGADLPANLDDERYGWNRDGRLIELFLAGCLLKGSLSLTGLDELKHLDCRNNDLEALDVSGNRKLEYLCCDNNQLTSLDVRENPLLRTLNCSVNLLKALDVKANTGLVTLRCQDNELEMLDLSDMAELRTALCYNNRLKRIGISGCARLETFDCSFNKLKTLDLSGAPMLDWMDCSHNRLETLDISANPLLRTLYYDETTLLKPPAAGSKKSEKAQPEDTRQAAMDMEKWAENLIEATWIVRGLVDNGKISAVPMEQLKPLIMECAQQFEEVHRDTDWMEYDYPQEVLAFTERFFAERAEDREEERE